MNPEFRRQLWLQFSTTRLIVLPALLVLGVLPILFSAEIERLPFVAGFASVAFAVLVFGMGMRAASASILDEFREHTWDQQRMSAMQPWAMTWGKLFGASAYSWYGGALCVLIYLPAAMAEGRPHVLLSVLAAVLAGVMLHATMLAVNLQLSKFDGRLAQRGGFWTLLGLACVMGLVYSGLTDEKLVSWWGRSFTHIGIAVLSLVVFTVCALVAAWRCMAESLAVRQLPWGWPALALVLTVFFGGFATLAPRQTALVGLFVSTLLTYVALVTEPQPRTVWQRVFARIAAGEWRPALQQLPRWPATLILTLAFALWMTLTPGFPFGAAELSMQVREYALLTGAPLAAALLVLRDCAIALFFSFNPRGRRPLGAFLVTLLVLYALLPWLVAAVLGREMLIFVMPVANAGLLGACVAAVHAAVALALLRWRWVDSRGANA